MSAYKDRIQILHKADMSSGLERCKSGVSRLVCGRKLLLALLNIYRRYCRDAAEYDFTFATTGDARNEDIIDLNVAVGMRNAGVKQLLIGWGAVK